VWPGLHAPDDRRVGAEILFHGTPAGVLDRRAPLDAAGDRRGSAIGRVPEGGSGQRACCGCRIGSGIVPATAKIAFSAFSEPFLNSYGRMQEGA